MKPEASNPLPQVAVNIRAARLEAGLTKEQLARQADVTLGCVYGWEDGRIPQGTNWPKLALALGRPVAWFYEEHGKHNRDRAA